VDWFVTGMPPIVRGCHNPSRVNQVREAGYQTETDDLDMSITAATTAEGTQTLPVSFFDDTRQAYTYPDVNENRSPSVRAATSQRDRAARRCSPANPAPQHQQQRQHEYERDPQTAIDQTHFQ
jgi:hypothetical protein